MQISLYEGGVALSPGGQPCMYPVWTPRLSAFISNLGQRSLPTWLCTSLLRGRLWRREGYISPKDALVCQNSAAHPFTPFSRHFQISSPFAALLYTFTDIMKFCISFRRKTSSSVRHPMAMAMAKAADLSSDDDLAESFRSLSMHKEPGASTQSTGHSQDGTQTTTPTQSATQSTPAIQSKIQNTTPSQTSPPTANSTQPPPQTTTPTQSSPPTAINSQQPPQQSGLSPLPTFPVSRPPICGKCHNSCTRRIVSASNRNNNANRPFYICRVCKEDPNIPGRSTEKGWISWDDSVGVCNTNRACYCGVACRQDRAGFESRYAGNGFWTCAYGTCDFLSYRRDCRTVREVIEKGLDPFDDIFVP